MGKRPIYIFLTLSITCGTASANIGNYDVLNGPLDLEAVEHATITMESENVDCVMHDTRVDVTAAFTFINNGPATDALMYFPVGVGFRIRNATLVNRYSGASEDGAVPETPFFLHRPGLIDGGEVLGAFQYAARPGDVRPDVYVTAITTGGDSFDKPGNYDTLKGFRVIANGVPVNIEIVERVILDKNGGGSEPGGEADPGWEGTVAKWRLHFREDEKKEVTCEYTVPYGEAKYICRPDVFKYSVSTGGGWAGPIGEGLIKVTYASEELGAPVYFSAPALPPAVVSATDDTTTITWAFTDLEPAEGADVSVYVGRNSGRIITSEEDESILVKYGNRPGIVRADKVDLKTDHSNRAPVVKKRPRIKKDTLFDARSSYGEWWYVRLDDGAEGWLRWRYVDADTGKENVYAEFAY